MYKILFNGNEIYTPGDVGRLLQSASLELSAGSAGQLKIQIGEENSWLSYLKKMVPKLEVQRDGTPIFRGRITDDSTSFTRVHTLTAEGVLACLNDTVIPPYNFPEDYIATQEYQDATNVVEFWLGKLLEMHNSQVTMDEQKIKLGNVTVSDSNNYITRSNEDYSTTWETVSEKLSGSSLGGYLMIRYESDGNYLDYISSFTTTNTQPVQYALNMLDMTDEVKAEEFYTAIYPIGKDGLTISLVDDTVQTDYVKTGNIIYSPDRVETYGRITRIVEWEDVTVDDILFDKAVAMLIGGAGGMPETITVSAADLSPIDSSYHAIEIGRTVRVKSEPHGIDALYDITQLTLDLINPSANTITVGKEKLSYTAEVNSQRADIERVVTDIKGTVQEAENNIDALADRITTAESNINQNETNITAEVKRSAAYQKQLSEQMTQIQQDATSLNVKVSDIQTNGVSQVVTSTGFKFDKDGLTVSKEGSQMTTNVDEDGMTVLRDSTAVLTADSAGVNAINLTARQYLIIGKNARFENYEGTRTGCFYVGG